MQLFVALGRISLVVSILSLILNATDSISVVTATQVQPCKTNGPSPFARSLIPTGLPVWARRACWGDPTGCQQPCHSTQLTGLGVSSQQSPQVLQGVQRKGCQQWAPDGTGWKADRPESLIYFVLP